MAQRECFVVALFYVLFFLCNGSYVRALSKMAATSDDTKDLNFSVH